jgi:hypothetical protein
MKPATLLPTAVPPIVVLPTVARINTRATMLTMAWRSRGSLTLADAYASRRASGQP